MTEELVLLLQLAGERRARTIVAGISTPGAAQAFERVAAIAYARKLLDDGVLRRDIAYRLAARFEISTPTAYRRVDDALNVRRPESVSTPGGV